MKDREGERKKKEIVRKRECVTKESKKKVLMRDCDCVCVCV